MLFPQQQSLLKQIIAMPNIAMTGEKFLFIQGCYRERPLTPELTEAQLRKAEWAGLVGGGATKSYFRAWNEHSIAVLPHPGSLQPRAPTNPAPLLRGVTAGEKIHSSQEPPQLTTIFLMALTTKAQTFATQQRLSSWS